MSGREHPHWPVCGAGGLVKHVVDGLALHKSVLVRDDEIPHEDEVNALIGNIMKLALPTSEPQPVHRGPMKTTAHGDYRQVDHGITQFRVDDSSNGLLIWETFFRDVKEHCERFSGSYKCYQYDVGVIFSMSWTTGAPISWSEPSKCQFYHTRVGSDALVVYSVIDKQLSEFHRCSWKNSK
jgi:hypothetical protein